MKIYLVFSGTVRGTNIICRELEVVRKVTNSDCNNNDILSAHGEGGNEICPKERFLGAMSLERWDFVSFSVYVMPNGHTKHFSMVFNKETPE